MIVPATTILPLTPYLGTSNYTITRQYRTDFESESEFVSVPGIDLRTTAKASQALASPGVVGAKHHRGWLTSGTADSENHRGYPAIQLYKYGSLSTFSPIIVTRWRAWTNILPVNQADKDWISLATFTSYADDLWARVISVNVDYNGFVHLMHIPSQGARVPDFEPHLVTFPPKQWTMMTVMIDYRGGSNSEAKVWQGDELVSTAHFNPRLNPALDIPSTVETGGMVYTGGLSQTHFGLYCAMLLTTANTTDGSGVPEIKNDDLTIYEVSIP